MTSEAVKALVAQEIAMIEDPMRRERLAACLVEPRVETRFWEYAEVGEPDEFPCWIVAEMPMRRSVLVYCEHGFGPSMPWGSLGAAGGSLEMDWCWDVSLEDAAVRGGLFRRASPGDRA